MVALGRVFNMGILFFASVSCFVDVADKDVSVFVIVPRELKLTVPAGSSFRARARDFCNDHGLDDYYLGNITSALEIRYEELKKDEEPLLSVSIKMTEMDQETNETKETNEHYLDLYSGDTLFDGVYRFCAKHNLNIYDYGRQLEELVLNSVKNLTATRELSQFNLTEELIAQGTNPVISLNNETSEITSTMTQAEVNNTRFKLFTLPIKVDNKNVELDFYNGDKLNEKISEFCVEYGLNETVAKQPLIDAVMNYSQAVQQKFPNSLWFESM